MADRRGVEVELGHRAVDHQLVMMAVDDQHLAVEGVGFGDDRPQHRLERSAVVAQPLVERVRVEGEHDGAVAGGAGGGEGRLDPGEIRPLAARELAPVLLDTQLLVVALADHVEGGEGRAAVLPARVLGELRERLLLVALASQRHPADAHAERLAEEDLAHEGQDLDRVGAVAVRLPAVGPFVVAGGVEHRRREAVEEGALAFLEGPSAVAPALGVADVDGKGGIGRVDGVDHLPVERVVGRDGVGGVAERHEAEGLRVGGGEPGQTPEGEHEDRLHHVLSMSIAARHRDQG